MLDNRTAPYAATVLRVSLGFMYIAHSLVLKHFTFTLPGTAQFSSVPPLALIATSRPIAETMAIPPGFGTHVRRLCGYAALLSSDFGIVRG